MAAVVMALYALAEDMAPAVPPAPPAPAAVALTPITDGDRMAAFLDRLMQVESGGRDTAKNPRSTALGAFQFIESTFIEVARRRFAEETANLTPAQVLALRTDRAFARRAAEALTRENMAVLAAGHIAPTFANLRLAYLVGASAAVRLHRAEPAAPVIGILGVPVVQANPFMAGMAARDLLAWSERNVSGIGPAIAAQAPPGSAAAALASRDAGNSARAEPSKPAPPAIKVDCNLGLASCRRWLALAQKAQARQQVAAVRPSRKSATR